MAITAIHKEITFGVGDIIKVHQRLFEAASDKKGTATGEIKSRIQIFEGTVIAIRGNGMGKSVIVRRIGNQGIGMEMIFPLFAPTIEKVEVSRSGYEGSRRAKLYYIREKSKREIDKIYRRNNVKEKPTEVAAKPAKKAAAKKVTPKSE